MKQIHFIVIAILIAGIALGVAIFREIPEKVIERITEKNASLGGVTNFDELGSNNVGEGFVRLLSTSTSLTTDTSHRLAWLNNVLVDGVQKSVIVSAADFILKFDPVLSGTVSTSSPYIVYVATSSSKTSATEISDYDAPLATRPVLMRGWIIASSSPATTTSALLLMTNGQSNTVGGSINPNGSTTKANLLSNLVVAYGEAVQIVIQAESHRRGCSDSNFNGGAPSCTTATSTDRNFTLEAFFKYRFNDQTQSTP